MDELWFESTPTGRKIKSIGIILKLIWLLFSSIGFLIGAFGNSMWLIIFCGCLIVIYDILDILSGELKPLFPISLAIVLALIFKPWYIGVFWASAIWHILSIPWYIAGFILTIKKK